MRPNFIKMLKRHLRRRVGPLFYRFKRRPPLLRRPGMRRGKRGQRRLQPKHLQFGRRGVHQRCFMLLIEMRSRIPQVHRMPRGRGSLRKRRPMLQRRLLQWRLRRMRQRKSILQFRRGMLHRQMHQWKLRSALHKRLRPQCLPNWRRPLHAMLKQYSQYRVR